jgi:acetyl esterase/lipase
MKRTTSLSSTFGVIAAAASIIMVPPLAAQDLAKPIVYSVPGMDKADAHLDIVYRRDGAEEMKTDIYVPPGLSTDARLPAVIFIHGGPLGKNPSPGAKDWGIYRSYGRLMAASGLVGVTFDHRYVSMKVKDLETSFADVEELVRFVRTNAASYHIDPERIALWAFSGGGPHLSLGLRGDRTFIRCLVSYYASLDLTSGAGQIGESPEALERYSPASYLTEDAASAARADRPGRPGFFEHQQERRALHLEDARLERGHQRAQPPVRPPRLRRLRRRRSHEGDHRRDRDLPQKPPSSPRPIRCEKGEGRGRAPAAHRGQEDRGGPRLRPREPQRSRGQGGEGHGPRLVSSRLLPELGSGGGRQALEWAVARSKLSRCPATWPPRMKRRARSVRPSWQEGSRLADRIKA